MPKNVGRLNQGTIKTMEAKGSKINGEATPTKTPHSGPVPKNQIPTRDNGNTVGRK